MGARVLSLAALMPLVVGLTAGCGQEKATQPRAEKPSGAAASSSAPDPAACTDLLSSDAVAQLAGEDMGEPRPVDVGGLEACRWDAADESPWVQVVRLPAAEWAASLPELFEQVRRSGLADGENLRKLEQGLELLESGELDDEGACRLFTTMVVDIQGAPAGSQEIVNYVPTQTDPLGVNAQACSGGVYASVQLVADDIEVSVSMTTRMQGAVEQVLRPSRA